MKKKKFDVHVTIPICVHVTVEAENGEQALKIAAQRFNGFLEYAGNGGTDKLIGVEGTDESVTIDGNVKFDDWTEH